MDMNNIISKPNRLLVLKFVIFHLNLSLFCIGLVASPVSLTLVDWIQVVVYIKQEIKLS